MTVTFCGHSEVANSAAVAAALEDIIEKLIADGADEFLLGGYGEFDSMAAVAVRNAKQKHPSIRSTLVIPYIDRGYDPALYDASLYPPLETVPRRFAINYRNKWMLNKSNIVVTYVTRNFGGAWEFKQLAENKQKTVLCLS